MLNVLDNTLTVPPKKLISVTRVLTGDGKPWAGAFLGIDIDHIIRPNSKDLCADPFDEEELRTALHANGVRGFIGFASSESEISLLWGWRFTDSGISRMIGSLTWKEI